MQSISTSKYGIFTFILLQKNYGTLIVTKIISANWTPTLVQQLENILHLFFLTSLQEHSWSQNLSALLPVSSCLSPHTQRMLSCNSSSFHRVCAECRLLFCVAVYEVTEDGWIIKGDKQYFFSTESTSMEKARTFCKNHRGDLAIVGDNNQRIFLWKYVRGNLITFYYIQHIYSAAYACEVQEAMLVA